MPRLMYACVSSGLRPIAVRNPGDRPVQLPLADEQVAEVVVRLRVPRLHRQRLLIGRDRLIPLALAGQGEAYEVVCLGALGVELDHLAESVDRLLPAVHGDQGVAEAVMA